MFKALSIILLVLLISNTLSMEPISHCMGKCLNCNNFDLTRCEEKQGAPACEPAYKQNLISGDCELYRSMNSPFVYGQLNEQRTFSSASGTTGWNQGKVMQCTYSTDSGSKRYFDAIGLFREIHSVSQEFTVSQNHEVYFISFNLLRNQWMPFNDFLIIDIESGTELVSSTEISYDSKAGFNDSNLVTCNGQSVVSEKFELKVQRKSFKSNTVKMTLTGFLFTASWGLTNFKLTPGCEHFTIYNKLDQKCSFCDIGFYPFEHNGEVFECKKCPKQCGSCTNQDTCTSCRDSYRLSSGKCLLNSEVRILELKQFSEYEEKMCRVLNLNFTTNSNTQRLTTLSEHNPLSHEFADCTLRFTLVYNSKFKAEESKIDVKANGVLMETIDSNLLINKGFEACSEGSEDRYTTMVLDVPLRGLNESVVIELQGHSTSPKSKFGIGSMIILYEENPKIKAEELENVQMFDTYQDAQKSLNTVNAGSQINTQVEASPAVEEPIVPAVEPSVQEPSTVQQQEAPLIGSSSSGAGTSEIQEFSVNGGWPEEDDAPFLLNSEAGPVPDKSDILDTTPPSDPTQLEQPVITQHPLVVGDEASSSPSETEPTSGTSSAQPLQISEGAEQPQEPIGSVVEPVPEVVSEPSELTAEEPSQPEQNPEVTVEASNVSVEEPTPQTQGNGENTEAQSAHQQEELSPESQRENVETEQEEDSPNSLASESSVDEGLTQEEVQDQGQIGSEESTPEESQSSPEESESRPEESESRPEESESSPEESEGTPEESESSPEEARQSKDQQAEEQVKAEQRKTSPIRRAPIQLPLSPAAVDHIQYADHGSSGIQIEIPAVSKESLTSRLLQAAEVQTTEYSEEDNEYILTIKPSEDSNETLFTARANSQKTEDQEIVNFEIDRSYQDVYLHLANAVNPEKKVVGFGVDRLDYVSSSEQNIFNSFSGLFSFFAWLGLVLLLASTFVGKYSLATEYLLSLQLVFLSIYVYSEYLPGSVSHTLSGLRRLENLNLFSTESLNSLERALLGDLKQDSPLRFTQFTEDINFTRNVLPLILIFLIAGTIFLVNFLIKKLRPSENAGQEEEEAEAAIASYERVQQNIVNRRVNYFGQLLLITFVPLAFICLKQFHNFSYPEGHSGQVPNMLLCLIVFIALIVGNVALIVNIEKEYYTMEYHQFVRKYSDMFHKRIPISFLPTNHHLLIYPILRFAKLFFWVMMVAIFGNHPLAVGFTLVPLLAADSYYNWHFEIFQNSMVLKFALAENILFAVLHTLHILMYFVSDTASTDSYLGLGYVFMSVAVGLALMSCIRVGYYGYEAVLKLTGNYVASKEEGSAPLRSERVV